jgi:hypothetical protein
MGEDPEHCKLLLTALARAVDGQARAREAWKRSGCAAGKGSTRPAGAVDPLANDHRMRRQDRHAGPRNWG